MKTRRWFNRNRFFSIARIASAGTLLTAGAAMAVFAASGPPARNFDAAGDGGTISTSFVPRSLSAEPMIVVVQLKDKSVAEAQADAGRKLTKPEKDQIKNQLKASQDGLKPHIQMAGGKVLAQFQSALNGIKVQIPASKLSKLSSLPGVTALLPVREDFPINATSVPYIGAPTVWDAPTNFRGEGIKIAIIDSGVDYTHANFGGPGTAAAFAAADATDTVAADPAQFGPAAPKVKGGFDLVGDDYNASANLPDGTPDTAKRTPHPDPNPLDCRGHGSHVAGTAAGFGVTSGGATYAGPYNPGIYTAGAFRVGPGVAPKADIYAYRVFGCAGSTNVTVDAINMAFNDGVDVINMSLGSPFGTADDASAVASTNVAKAGVIVVASAGNEGANQYITGSPATGTGAISVAANDANGSFPAATMAISTDGTITAQNSNGAAFTNGTVYQVAVLRDSYPNGPVSLGCTDADYTNYPGGVSGKLVVTVRGTCSRVGRAIRAERFGAAAAAMLNTDSGYPPFEGPITSDPDNGFQFTVTIPFFGIRGVLGPSATTDPDNLITADTPQGAGGTVTVTNTTLTNPNFSGFASFSSRGPRTGDSWLKPDITAPGVSTLSTLVGSGNQGTIMSGTSMAAPHVAGVAALVKQAHPTWNQVQEWKAAIVNTGNPSAIGGSSSYRTSRGGTGLVQPVPAVNTNVIALGVGNSLSANTGMSTLNFGFSELNADFSQTKLIKLRNKGGTPATFNISQTNATQLGVSAHSIVLGSSSVTISAGAEVTVGVTLNVPVATVGNSSGGLAFREVAGLITFTPATASDNNNVTLRVPYYLVPRALSGVNATMAKTVTTTSPSTNANLSNPSGPITGNADFYAWGLNDPKESASSADVRAIGAQSFDCAAVFGAPTCAAFAADRFIVFAVNNHNRWSNAATNEFDIYVDVNPAANDGDDYIIVGVDQGAVQTGTFNGRLAAFVFSTRSAGASLVFLATAPTDSSTALLPIFNSQLCRTGEPCLSAVNPRLTYHAFGFDLTSSFVDVVAGTAKYNAYSSSISQGAFVPVPKGASVAVPVSINPTEWAQTPALGEMIVTLDNAAGKGEAALLPLALTP
jgi:minor extracellular serine protease Vpr